jgi:hypothetical protein
LWSTVDLTRPQGLLEAQEAVTFGSAPEGIALFDQAFTVCAQAGDPARVWITLR